MKKSMMWWVPVLVFVDQLTKAWIRARLDYREWIDVFDGFFRIYHAQNTGAAWGLLSGLPDPIRAPFFVTVSAVTSLILYWYYRQVPMQERVLRSALVLILAGAIGNLVDRALFGQVTDFLDVYVSSGWLFDLLRARGWITHWPTFNVADICISTGVGLFLVYTIFIEPRHRKAAAEDSAAQ
jgi:signal peptidase II